jgi:hypothetical protein
MLIKGPQRKEKCDNKKRAGTGAMLIKGPRRDEECDNKESGRRSQTFL